MRDAGKAKNEFCDRLGHDWNRLADSLQIKPAVQARFERGDEGRGIWQLLESQRRLSDLPKALIAIDRADLAELLTGATGQQTLEELEAQHFKSHYQNCIERWSGRYALDKRFVHLSLLLDQGEEAKGPRWQVGSEKFQDLREVLEKVTAQALVLLGPPGSGKSTLLRHFELESAQSALTAASGTDITTAPLTFFIQLNEYKPERPGQSIPLPKEWLAERWEKSHPNLPHLEKLLRGQQMTLLLDALNEIPFTDPEPVELWRVFVSELQDYPGSRVIFSCRSLDYSASLSSKELPVPQVRIELLTPEQVQRFIELYCPEHAEKLWKNLKDTPQLELFRSPYYLKMLVEQSTEGQIPEGHAALFTSVARRAMKREVEGDNPLFQPGELLEDRDRQRLIQARAWKTAFELPERGILIPKLSHLAFQMQSRRSVNEATQVRIDYDEALKILDHVRSGELLKAGVDLGVLEQDLDRDEVLYVHQLLQEYFAARQLARQPQPDRVKQEWHVKRVSPSLEETLARLADSDPLLPLPGSGWEVTVVLAAAMAQNPDQFVTALIEANLPLAARCAAQPDVAVSDQVKDKLRWALVQRTQEESADLRARIAAGLALGELGDPRFERRPGPYGPYLLPPLIEIQGGTYRIGSDEGHYDDEKPVHGVELAPFKLGKFPVTNAEWALFLSAGGYDDERWWETDEAKAWQSGKSTAEGAKEQRREHRKWLQENFQRIRALQREGGITSKQADNWERIAQMGDEEFEALLASWYPPGRQTQPALWNDDAFNNPQQPVVGICWHEARAYCAWLSAQTGVVYWLPTEAEWEAAARGRASRRFAYGNRFDPARCNTFETHIRRTTPIGVFPGGETGEPAGLVDMTGNVWEWTSTLYKPYPYRGDDGREGPNGTVRRVVRGGSWYHFQVVARAAFRNLNFPAYRDHFIGFRVVSSSPIFPKH